MKKCPQCGMPVPNDAKICPYCHFKFVIETNPADDHSLSWFFSGAALAVGAFIGWLVEGWKPFWIGLIVAVALFLFFRLVYEHD